MNSLEKKQQKTGSPFWGLDKNMKGETKKSLVDLLASGTSAALVDTESMSGGLQSAGSPPKEGGLLRGVQQ